MTGASLVMRHPIPVDIELSIGEQPSVRLHIYRWKFDDNFERPLRGYRY